MAKTPKTQAIKSKYQDDPWEPMIDESSKDHKDEEKAAADYVAVYGGSPTYGTEGDDDTPPADSQVTPTLTAAYTLAPDLVPTKDDRPGDHGAGPTPPAPPLADAFSIQLGMLRTTEQAFLDATNTARAAYDDLRKVVLNAVNSSSLFGQEVGSEEAVPTGNTAAGGGTDRPEWVADPLDSESIAFAAAINPQMEAKLVEAGNVIELMGVFSALLNNAGQMYTETDATSVFPPPLIPNLGHGPVVHPGGGPGQP